MSAPGIAIPSSVQRETEPQSQTQSRPEQDIATLAYALWQGRGCPEDSAENDWLEAERLLNEALKQQAAVSNRA